MSALINLLGQNSRARANYSLQAAQVEGASHLAIANSFNQAVTNVVSMRMKQRELDLQNRRMDRAERMDQRRYELELKKFDREGELEKKKYESAKKLEDLQYLKTKAELDAINDPKMRELLMTEAKNKALTAKLQMDSAQQKLNDQRNLLNQEFIELGGDAMIKNFEQQINASEGVKANPVKVMKFIATASQSRSERMQTYAAELQGQLDKLVIKSRENLTEHNAGKWQENPNLQAKLDAGEIVRLPLTGPDGKKSSVHGFFYPNPADPKNPIPVKGDVDRNYAELVAGVAGAPEAQAREVLSMIADANGMSTEHLRNITNEMLDSRAAFTQAGTDLKTTFAKDSYKKEYKDVIGEVDAMFSGKQNERVQQFAGFFSGNATAPTLLSREEAYPYEPPPAGTVETEDPPGPKPVAITPEAKENLKVEMKAAYAAGDTAKGRGAYIAYTAHNSIDVLENRSEKSLKALEVKANQLVEGGCTQPEFDRVQEEHQQIMQALGILKQMYGNYRSGKNSGIKATVRRRFSIYRPTANNFTPENIAKIASANNPMDLIEDYYGVEPVGKYGKYIPALKAVEDTASKIRKTIKQTLTE